MKLDPTYLQYISKEELRVLLSIELGMRNHEYVPVHLIERISHLKKANAFKVIKLLLKQKLISHVQKKYDGYKLNYLGYDYLALYSFMKRGHIKTVIGKIGVGKESDIYKCVNNEGQYVVLKFGRLGRVSFKTIKRNRDYLKHRSSFNWLYLSRLAALKEFSFMKVLYKNNFPTPVPIDWNRHGIVMSLIDGYTLCNVRQLEEPKVIFDQLIELLKKFAENGLIHSDFNEFNILITKNRELTIIDFPQMVSTSHFNSNFYYERDLNCIITFFSRRYGYNVENDFLKLKEIKVLKKLDIEVKASGFIKKELQDKADDLDLLDYYHEGKEEESENSDENSNSEENSDDEEEEENWEINSKNEENQMNEKLEEFKISENEEDFKNEKKNDEQNEEVKCNFVDKIDEKFENELKDEENEEEKEESEEEKKGKNNKKSKKEKRVISEKEIVKKEFKKKYKKHFKMVKNHTKLKEKIVADDYFF